MSNEFVKHHIEGLPFGAVIHHFTGIDRGGPHCHPFGFQSTILKGGYVERVYDVDRGYSKLIERRPGESFHVPARHVHEIVELPEGECWTLIVPGPWEREPGFWRFDQAGAYFRPWNEREETFIPFP